MIIPATAKRRRLLLSFELLEEFLKGWLVLPNPDKEFPVFRIKTAAPDDLKIIGVVGVNRSVGDHPYALELIIESESFEEIILKRGELLPILEVRCEKGPLEEFLEERSDG